MKFLTSLCLGTTLFLAACSPAPAPSSSSGGVAVIDLDAIAKRLGRESIIIQEIKDAGTVLNQQLAEAQKGLVDEFEKSKQSIGAKPTQEDTQKLTEIGRNLNLQFQQKQQQAQQELASKRNALVTRFKEEVKPIAMKIASSKGLSVVLIRNETFILGTQPEVDITDAVVAEMTKAGAPAN